MDFRYHEAIRGSGKSIANYQVAQVIRIWDNEEGIAFKVPVHPKIKQKIEFQVRSPRFNQADLMF